MCRRTTDRWKYPHLFCSLLRMQFWRSHVWRATYPLGIPHSFKWTHCSGLSQLFYCFINVNLKTLDLLSMCYIHTYLLTPWCRVLLEKLTGLQLVKKFPAFHGTRKFITALTSVRHLSLSWASPIQSICPHPTSWRSILILSTHLRLGLPSGLFPSGFPTKTLYTPLSSPIRTKNINSCVWLHFTGTCEGSKRFEPKCS